MEMIKRFPINWSMAIAFKGAEEQGLGNQEVRGSGKRLPATLIS